MGSGKSSAGKGIAALLRWNFADIDKLVEDNEGISVAEIFASKGEDHFRAAETEALRTVSVRSRTVVACGGGTPCNEGNIALMKATGVTVYLKLPVEALVSRLKRSRIHRPLIQDAAPADLETRVQEILSARRAWYEQADIIMDAATLNVEEMTALIAGAIRSKGAYL